jgi:hypothetical protein
MLPRESHAKEYEPNDSGTRFSPSKDLHIDGSVRHRDQRHHPRLRCFQIATRREAGFPSCLVPSHKVRLPEQGHLWKCHVS